MTLLFVPAGEFLMGSTAADAGADGDEIPQHTVFLDSFWIDQTEVTNAMFAAFLNERGNQMEGNAAWLDAGDEDALLAQTGGIWQPKAGFEAFPAIEVTWYGAQAYCQWARRSLPSEAQWEKAARGSEGQIYPWGTETACDKAQVANCNAVLQAVGSKPAGASPYGALDMAGNVWEWVADWYDPAYYADSPVENPGGPETGETRSLRGGAWEYDWKHARAANRRHNGPAASMHEYGFRCALPVPP
jgi:formylglycine-generating enzyme required for sulfatase activity